jgi:hypothetical protein
VPRDRVTQHKEVIALWHVLFRTIVFDIRIGVWQILWVAPRDKPSFLVYGNGSPERGKADAPSRLNLEEPRREFVRSPAGFDCSVGECTTQLCKCDDLVASVNALDVRYCLFQRDPSLSFPLCRRNI